MIDNSKAKKTDLYNRIQKAANDIGKLVSIEAKSRVPVDTGDLKQSISYVVKKDNGKTIVSIGTPAPYAVYVEKGTGVHAADGNGRKTSWVYKDPRTGEFVATIGQRPQPYLFPAFYYNLANIEAIIRGAFK